MVLKDVEIAKCYAVFEAVYGKNKGPEIEEDLTVEQLSALNFLLKV